jgi:hypothetical protein
MLLFFIINNNLLKIKRVVATNDKRVFIFKCRLTNNPSAEFTNG